MAKKYVIIGGSAAGPKTASKIRRMDQEADITIIQKGSYLSMASCGYPYFVGGVFDDPNKLISTPTGVVRDSTFFMNVKDIKAIVSTEVIEIDRSNRKVICKQLETNAISEVPYDKLLISTGANPIVPQFPGADLEGITTLQSMEDAVYIKNKVKEEAVKKAVIVGGGLIGIETAEAFVLGGIDLTLVEMQNQILPFLDWEIAKIIENCMVSKGVAIKTESKVVGFVGENGKVTGVKLGNGDLIDCDMVVVSIGVRPNTAIAKAAELETGHTGGISVNKFMQTNDPDIYAAGDCVEITNLITHDKIHYPMGDAANLQGRVAAQNMVNGNMAEYDGAVVTGICKIFEYTAASTGLSEKEANRKGYSNILTAVHAAPDKPGFMGAKPIIMKMVADKTTGKLLGVQSVGLGEASKRIAIGAMALHGRLGISDLVTLDLPYAPPYSPAIDNFITTAHVLENKWMDRMEGISSVDLKKKVDDGENLFILDVRGKDEYEAMRLGIGEKLIPLGKLRSSTDLLPENKDQEIIVYCKISLRGYEASCFLKSQGYTNVKVLEGGIVAWPFKREK